MYCRAVAFWRTADVCEKCATIAAAVNLAVTSGGASERRRTLRVCSESSVCMRPHLRTRRDVVPRIGVGSALAQYDLCHLGSATWARQASNVTHAPAQERRYAQQLNRSSLLSWPHRLLRPRCGRLGIMEASSAAIAGHRLASARQPQSRSTLSVSTTASTIAVWTLCSMRAASTMWSMSLRWRCSARAHSRCAPSLEPRVSGRGRHTVLHQDLARAHYLLAGCAQTERRGALRPVRSAHLTGTLTRARF